MRKLTTTLLAALAVGAIANAASKDTENPLETKGTVQRYLLNPEGDVDGLLLQDGSQVNFPPHMSAELTKVVAPKDAVSIKGFRENAKVFKAESITNTKTEKSVVETKPEPPPGGPAHGPMAGAPPPPPPGGPKGPHGGPKREGLQQLSASGKIQNQIFGRRGEVNGVILSDGTIVRFGPRMIEDSKVKTDVGQNLRASGFGTKNANGQALEATELNN